MAASSSSEMSFLVVTVGGGAALLIAVLLGTSLVLRRCGRHERIAPFRIRVPAKSPSKARSAVASAPRAAPPVAVVPEPIEANMRHVRRAPSQPCMPKRTLSSISEASSLGAGTFIRGWTRYCGIEVAHTLSGSSRLNGDSVLPDRVERTV